MDVPVGSKVATQLHFVLGFWRRLLDRCRRMKLLEPISGSLFRVQDRPRKPDDHHKAVVWVIVFFVQEWEKNNC